MSHTVEEQKEVALQEASTPTAIEPESQVNIMSTDEHTDDY